MDCSDLMNTTFSVRTTISMLQSHSFRNVWGHDVRGRMRNVEQITMPSEGLHRTNLHVSKEVSQECDCRHAGKTS